MKNQFLGAIALGLVLVAVPASVRAQDTTATVEFPDVPQNHWAYQAVSDLAAKGYVKGYPEGVFGGKRAMTRYEFATVIERMLQTVTDLATKIAAIPTTPPVTPTGNFVTQDDLNKIQTLMDQFQKQLTAIGTPIAPVQDQIDALHQDLKDLQDRMTKLEKTNPQNAYGYAPSAPGLPPMGITPGVNRKFQFGGFVQARYQMAESGNRTSFPLGTPAVVGGAASYTGDYAIGGANSDLFARRVRLKFNGELTPNTRYAAQLDAANDPSTVSISSTTTSINPNQVQVLDANFQYTFGNGNPYRYTTLIAGGVINYFGFFLPQSPADFLTPERPLAFSEGGNGMWQNQDFDKGAYATIPFLNGFLAYAGVLDGNGRYTQNNKPTPDTMYRLRYAKNPKGFKMIEVGTSYYDGTLPRSGMANPSGEGPFTGQNYASGKKQLTGADAQVITTSGFTLLGEYVTGEFDERTFVNTENGSKDAPTSFTTNAWAPGNKVDGWYVQGGYRLLGNAVTSLTIAGSYDVFDRSRSGIGTGALDAAGNAIAGGASGSSFTDKNVGYGILYKLNRAAQLKLWYEAPNAVAHAANQPEPEKIGLFTTELLVRY